MKSSWPFTGAALTATLLTAPMAHAFCRTTTCDPNKPADHCQFDANRCVVTGKALGWRSSCVTVGVQQMGSPRNGLSYDDVAPLVEQAFGAWMQADCGSGTNGGELGRRTVERQGLRRAWARERFLPGLERGSRHSRGQPALDPVRGAERTREEDRGREVCR